MTAATIKGLHADPVPTQRKRSFATREGSGFAAGAGTAAGRAREAPRLPAGRSRWRVPRRRAGGSTGTRRFLSSSASISQVPHGVTSSGVGSPADDGLEGGWGRAGKESRHVTRNHGRSRDIDRGLRIAIEEA